jgi:hypothetical protein
MTAELPRKINDLLLVEINRSNNIQMITKKAEDEY